MTDIHSEFLSHRTSSATTPRFFRRATTSGPLLLLLLQTSHGSVQELLGAVLLVLRGRSLACSDLEQLAQRQRAQSDFLLKIRGDQSSLQIHKHTYTDTHTYTNVNMNDERMLSCKVVGMWLKIELMRALACMASLSSRLAVRACSSSRASRVSSSSSTDRVPSADRAAVISSSRASVTYS